MALTPVTWPSMSTRNFLGCSINSSRQSGHNGPVLVPGTGRYFVSHQEQNRSVGSAVFFDRRCMVLSLIICLRVGWVQVRVFHFVSYC